MQRRRLKAPFFNVAVPIIAWKYIFMSCSNGFHRESLFLCNADAWRPTFLKMMLPIIGWKYNLVANVPIIPHYTAGLSNSRFWLARLCCKEAKMEGTIRWGPTWICPIETRFQTVWTNDYTHGYFFNEWKRCIHWHCWKCLYWLITTFWQVGYFRWHQSEWT